MFIRYNEALDFWEYDTSVLQNGTGPWLKLPIDASKLNGTLPPASLPANVAYRNIDNSFSVGQIVNGNLGVSGNIYTGVGYYERARGVAAGEWQSYNPIWTQTTTQPTPGNAILIGAYTLIGKTCHFRASLKLGSTTVKGTGSFLLSLPVAAASVVRVSFSAWALNFAAPNVYREVVGFFSTTTTILFLVPGTSVLVNESAPAVWAANDELNVNGTYEIV